MRGDLPFDLKLQTSAVEFIGLGQIFASLAFVVIVVLGYLLGPVVDASILWGIGLGALVTSILAQILIVIWMYPACANAMSLVPDKRWIRPNWLVIWWFVPLFNIWQPYRAMSQIWNSSVDHNMDLNGPAAPAVTTWWLLLLLGPSLAGVFVGSNGNKEYATALALLFLAGSTASALTIVKTVRERQLDKLARTSDETSEAAIGNIIAKAAK
jgi:hypothetical protein